MVHQQPIDEAGAISVWFEALLYGIHCTLFFQSLYFIWLKSRRNRADAMRAQPAKILVYGTIIIWILVTVHVALNLYRLLRAYVWLRLTIGPDTYLSNLSRWDHITHDVVNALTTWVADVLLIYRCFLVWGNDYRVIAIPTVLLCTSVVANGVAFHLFLIAPFGTIFSSELVHWMDAVYGLALVQNTLTTGLLAYRIWRQGIQSSGVDSVMYGRMWSISFTVRIIIESAAVYVLELVVLIVLYKLKHNAQFILQEAVPPTVGIVFTLLTVRVAMRKSETLVTTVSGVSDLKWHRSTQHQQEGADSSFVQTSTTAMINSSNG